MSVEDWIKINESPEYIVTEDEILWDKHDGEIKEDWLLKRHISRIDGNKLIVI